MTIENHSKKARKILKDLEQVTVDSETTEIFQLCQEAFLWMPFTAKTFLGFDQEPSAQDANIELLARLNSNPKKLAKAQIIKSEMADRVKSALKIIYETQDQRGIKLPAYADEKLDRVGLYWDAVAPTIVSQLTHLDNEWTVKARAHELQFGYIRINTN